MKACLITGTNRGLGLAFVKWATDCGYTVFASARNEIPLLSEERENLVTRVYADLSKPQEAIDNISSIVKDTPLDFVIHNAGMVERDDFEATPAQEAQDVMNINVTTPLLLTRCFLQNIKSGKDKKVIFIGSVSGQNNSGCPSIFYAASRMGIVGATQNLRQNFKKDGISFPVIEPGCMATDIDYDDGEALAISKHDGGRMPVHDLIKTVEYILSLSDTACPKQLVVSNMTFESV